MTHHELMTTAAACIIDALGLQIEPIYLSGLLFAAVREKEFTGSYGKKQHALQAYLEMHRDGERDARAARNA